MRIASLVVVLAALLVSGSEAQPWKNKRFPFPGTAKDCSRSNSPPVKCSSDLDCVTSCRSNKFECVGCRLCPDSKGIDGGCFLKGTVAVRCANPSFDNPACKKPGCTANKRCLRDEECKECGDDFECKKCPPNGCPGREFGTCLPQNEPIFCTLELCINPSPPIDPPTPPPTLPPPSGKCETGGCSGELCVDPTKDPSFSACVFRPEFVCFRDAVCGNFGPGGSCGFKQTAELRKCLLLNTKEPSVLGVAATGG
ncbi:hypothetical protein BSKO_03851 [Bryopsis sp. KO-2023]|nr:hypothetical protein BSKO_03851 [Bryopsis sp. KO-2023]